MKDPLPEMGGNKNLGLGAMVRHGLATAEKKARKINKGGSRHEDINTMEISLSL